MLLKFISLVHYLYNAIIRKLQLSYQLALHFYWTALLYMDFLVLGRKDSIPGNESCKIKFENDCPSLGTG